jgi:hypothetical protein
VQEELGGHSPHLDVGRTGQGCLPLSISTSDVGTLSLNGGTLNTPTVSSLVLQSLIQYTNEVRGAKKPID